jgi:hypothetical protein
MDFFRFIVNPKSVTGFKKYKIPVLDRNLHERKNFNFIIIHEFVATIERAKM